jgi:transcriptional regulator NrdR family protein
MSCPKCRERTNVYDSRISFEGNLRRKRACPKCAHRFATVEILDRGRPLETRKQAPPKPKKVQLERAAPKAEVKRRAEPKARRFDDEVGEYEGATLDEDFAAVARELGIGGMNEFD